MGDVNSFADLIYPISEDKFFADYYLKKYVHIKSEDKDKLRSIMSWSRLNEILNMNAFWTPANLKLFLDTSLINPDEYCDWGGGIANSNSLRPNPTKVNHWLSRGASIVANDVDTLTAGLRRAADILEKKLSGKVQSNLYCSWRQHQAFPIHMDTHDVFALHVEGQKIWRIYDGKIDEPINHPIFSRYNQNSADGSARTLLEEIVLNPGDILYIPRGVFHEALASSEGCIHLSFGVTNVIGYDALVLLLDKALADPVFRKNMPGAQSPEGEKRDWLAKLGSEALSILTSEAFYKEIIEFQNEYFYLRAGYNLPDNIADEKSVKRFQVCFEDFNIELIEGEYCLSRGNIIVNIPHDIVDLVRWVLKTQNFDMNNLLQNFVDLSPERIDYAIENLEKMNVLRDF